MTYYYIYKITCTAGSFKDHYYIGLHKTENLDDGYKGSGVKIQSYYQKYPNAYKKEILCWCENEEDMNLKEDFYVGDLYKTDPKCLNLKAGGNYPGVSEEIRKKISESHKGKYAGENNPFYGKHHSEETKKKISEAKNGKYVGENAPMYGKHHSEETRKKMSEAHKGEKHPMYGVHGENAPMYGKHHSEETRKKMSEAHKGEKHPGYGRKWMNNGLQEKYVKQDEVHLFKEKGYSFGRLMKFSNFP